MGLSRCLDYFLGVLGQELVEKWVFKKNFEPVFSVILGNTRQLAI